jgi:hypothetical protein
VPISTKAVRLIRRIVFRQSELDMVIPPEVKDDGFSKLILAVASLPDVTSVLEIGSSSGAGSTVSLFNGLLGKESKQLYCLELSLPRFAELSSRYREHEWIHCLNLPSISADQMPNDEDVARFFAQYPESPLCRSKVSEVQRWLRQDKEYLAAHTFIGTGVREALRLAQVDSFDLVLIDGSEFTGEAELAEVYGAKYVLLDDTETFKNRASMERLGADPDYELLRHDPFCRNGYAGFRRKA